MTIFRFLTTARPARLAAALLAIALLAPTGTSLPAVAAEMTVKIANFTFAPQSLSVHAGTTVTWVNDDDIPHVIAEKDGQFRSKALDTGDSFSQVFTKPGKVEYYCAIHPHMTGEIVVTP
jgi:plastocyanin